MFEGYLGTGKGSKNVNWRADGLGVEWNSDNINASLGVLLNLFVAESVQDKEDGACLASQAITNDCSLPTVAATVELLPGSSNAEAAKQNTESQPLSDANVIMSDALTECWSERQNE